MLLVFSRQLESLQLLKKGGSLIMMTKNDKAL